MTEDAKSSLLDLARGKVKDVGPQCSIKTLRLQSPDKTDEIDDLLANTGKDPGTNQPRGDGIPYSVAAEALNESFAKNYDGQTVSRHINHRCGCR